MLGRFRMQLGTRLEAILSEIVAQLEEARIILAEGRVSIVDATVVESAQSWFSTADPEAGNNVKINARGKKCATWGRQAFVNADEDGFIQRTAISPGNEV